MENVIILDQNNSNLNISVVRYFMSNTIKYLIYTLNEKDENGYIKLYASRISDASLTEKIVDENEWNYIKELIKVIVKEAKEGELKTVTDLNLKDLTAVKVNTYRLFKLADNVVNMLSANKKVFTEQPVVEAVKLSSLEELLSFNKPTEPVVESTPVMTAPVMTAPVYGMPEDDVTPAVDYQTMYVDEKKKTDALSVTITELNQQIANYQTKLDQVTSDMSIKLAEYQIKLEDLEENSNIQSSPAQQKLDQIKQILE